jgi:hypothetical protein
MRAQAGEFGHREQQPEKQHHGENACVTAHVFLLPDALPASAAQHTAIRASARAQVPSQL